MPKIERQKKTPAERATERHGIATRAVDNLEKKAGKLKSELETVTVELEQAKARLSYVAGDPDLPANHTTPIPEVEVDATVAGVRSTKPKGRAVKDAPQA